MEHLHWLHLVAVGPVQRAGRQSWQLPVFLKPVIAALLAAFILNDDITTTQMAAIFAITGFVAAEIFYEPLRGRFGKAG